MRVILWSVAGMLVGAMQPVAAQSPLTANTLQSEAGAVRPDARIEDVAWIEGHWRGSAFGGTSEEIWSPPMAGSMMGVYRSIEDGAVRFYEILQLVPDGNSLTLRLKHFDADLTGWEERDEVRTFPLLQIEPGKAWFEGMTFERVSADEIVIHLAIRRDDGSHQEVEFRYQRVGVQ